MRFFNHRREEIAVHVQGEPGKFTTHPGHIAPEKISGVERGAEWLLMKASSIGTHDDQLASAVIRQRRAHGMRAVMGLLALSDKYASREIDKACQIAHGYGAYQLKSVRALLGSQAARQEQLVFVDDHLIIGEIGVYGNLVHTAFQNTPTSDSSRSPQDRRSQS